MKTLKNYLILYDAECPMCNMYTQAFVNSGMLDADGREAYQNISQAVCPMVDRHRAVNEIALVNQETGEVSYGIKSLMVIIAHSFPVLNPLFSFKPFVWFMAKIYAFISYNRRVIVPATNNNGANEIQPDFKLHYRIAYLLFTWLITATVLTNFTPLLGDFIQQARGLREYFICGGQIIFQGIIIYFLKGNRRDYLGNMMTISFAGALLLLPGLLIAKFFNLPTLFYAAYFMVIAGLMFLEHIRRTKLLKIGWIPTFSWAFYRVMILAFLLFVA